MAFTDRPLAADRKRLSQDHIRQNFLEIEAFADEDHVTFGGGADLGKHLKTVFPENGRVALADAPVTLANEAAIYCRQSDVGATSALFFRPEGQGAGAGVERDFTTLTGNAASGYTQNANGLKIAWGTGQLAGGDHTEPVAFLLNTFFGAAANSVFSVQITPTSIATTAHNAHDYLTNVTAITRAGFSLQRPATRVGATIDFSYVAIGI